MCKSKPYDTKEFFSLIMNRLKEKELVPEHLDYILPTSTPAEIKTYDFTIRNYLDFGGNEGIYLSLRLRTSTEEYNLGTIKTLQESRAAMEDMAKLLADFICEARDFVDSNLEDFDWSGYAVRAFDDSGKKTIGIKFDSLEEAFKKKSILELTYPKVIVYDQKTRNTVKEASKCITA